METRSTSTAVLGVLSWVFGIIFLTIGVLNLFLVHPVPGIFYILLSFFYFPPADALLKKKVGFVVPRAAKILVGLIVLWGTLAVGDLAEMFGL